MTLIVALDYPRIERAEKLVEKLQGEVDFYKVGAALLALPGALHFVQRLKKKNCRVFIDAKNYDIESTIKKVVAAYALLEVDLLTVHAEKKTMEAAAHILKKIKKKFKQVELKILAVTVMTNMNIDDLKEQGIYVKGDEKKFIAKLVLKRARQASKAGIDGVIASPLEAAKLRKKLGDDFIICTPGIRLDDGYNTLGPDNQKRIATPASAIGAGADYIVVGRPITQAINPLLTVQKIKAQIKTAKAQRK